jgi:hypothetical protein
MGARRPWSSERHRDLRRQRRQRRMADGVTPQVRAAGPLRDSTPRARPMTVADEERSAVLAGAAATGRAADDAALVARAAAGQPEAFDQLIRPRLDRLYGMALTILRNEADARDAVQEACVLAWRECRASGTGAASTPGSRRSPVNASPGPAPARSPHARPRDRCRRPRTTSACDRRARGIRRGRGDPACLRPPDPDTRSLLALHYVRGEDAV